MNRQGGDALLLSLQPSTLLSAGGVPDEDFAQAGADEDAAARGIGERPQQARMPLERRFFFSLARLPDFPQGVVAAARQAAIGGKAQRTDRAAVSLDRFRFALLGKVPKLDYPVVAAGGEKATVARHRQGDDGIIVARQRRQFFARGGAPPCEKL